jgi:hypothetical protein
MNVVVLRTRLHLKLGQFEPNAEVDIRSTPPNDANEIADNPVAVMVTLAPDTCCWRSYCYAPA